MKSLLGGEKTKKQILILSTVLIALTMMAVPVLAIGPENAENNPNITFYNYGPGLTAPSGMHNEWVNTALVTKHIQWVDAANFQVGNAVVLTSIAQVAQNENKWCYFSMNLWEAWLVHTGIPAPIAHMIALQYPDGVYYKEAIF